MEDQKVFVFVISGVLLTLFLVTVFILSIVRYNKRLFVHKQEKQNLQSKYQQELLQTQLEIQEQTFKNISQEIHDNIGQVLSLIKLNINTMNCDEPAALNEKIRNSRNLISKVIQDLRDISKSLNTDYINDLGLVRSIKNELELIKKTGSYEVLFETNGIIYKLDQLQELIIFRIFQEAINNILRHAKARKIYVLLNFELNNFAMQIRDDGVGFNSVQLRSDNGFGLGIRNMNNRAQVINADFKLASSPYKGTDITLTLPLNKSAF